MNRLEARKKLAKKVGIEFKEEERLEFLNCDPKGRPKSVSIDKVVDYLLKKYSIKTIFGKKSESCYIFLDGIYELKAREIISEEVEKLLGSWCKSNIVEEIFKKIKRKTIISSEEFAVKPLHIIPLKNGLFNLKTKKLEPHKNSYYFTQLHPVEYKEDAECPEFKSFLAQILPEEDHQVIQEMVGFFLYRSYFLKKCFIFVGSADTGKTTLLNIISEIIGLKNISGLALQVVASADRMRLYFLKDKTLNLYDDLGKSDIVDVGGLKIATGGGLITAEEKFGDLIQFQNHAKMLFACNKIPSIKDKDDTAFYIRWLPFEFINVIPKEEQDPFLLQKIIKEKSGILKWALEGLVRLLHDKKFSYEKTPDEIKRIMQSGDPLVAFAQESLLEQSGYKISKEDMFSAYTLWANEKVLLDSLRSK